MVTALIAAVSASHALADDGATPDDDDLAFFEFLGSFSDDDGAWLDPIELEASMGVTQSATTIEDVDANEDPDASAGESGDVGDQDKTERGINDVQ